MNILRGPIMAVVAAEAGLKEEEEYVYVFGEVS